MLPRSEGMGQVVPFSVRGLGAAALVEFAEQMKQQCTTRWAERQISQLIEDDKVEAQQPIGDCHDFRVWAGIMGKKESPYVPTQRTRYT